MISAKAVSDFKNYKTSKYHKFVYKKVSYGHGIETTITLGQLKLPLGEISYLISHIMKSYPTGVLSRSYPYPS